MPNAGCSCCNFICKPSGCIFVYNPYTLAPEPSVPVGAIGDFIQLSGVTVLKVFGAGLLSGTTNNNNGIYCGSFGTTLVSNKSFNKSIPGAPGYQGNGCLNNCAAGITNARAPMLTLGVGSGNCVQINWFPCESDVCSENPQIIPAPYCPTILNLTGTTVSSPSHQICATLGCGSNKSGVCLDFLTNGCLPTLPFYSGCPPVPTFFPDTVSAFQNGFGSQQIIQGELTWTDAQCVCQPINLCGYNTADVTPTNTVTGCFSVNAQFQCPVCPQYGEGFSGSGPPFAVINPRPLPQTVTVTLGNSPGYGALQGQQFILNLISGCSNPPTWYAVIPSNNLIYSHVYFLCDDQGNVTQMGCAADMPAAGTITLIANDLESPTEICLNMGVAFFFDSNLVSCQYTCCAHDGTGGGAILWTNGCLGGDGQTCFSECGTPSYYKDWGAAQGCQNNCVQAGPPGRSQFVCADQFGKPNNDPAFIQKNGAISGGCSFDICPDTGINIILMDTDGNLGGVITN